MGGPFTFGSGSFDSAGGVFGASTINFDKIDGVDYSTIVTLGNFGSCVTSYFDPETAEQFYCVDNKLGLNVPFKAGKTRFSPDGHYFAAENRSRDNISKFETSKNYNRVWSTSSYENISVGSSDTDIVDISLGGDNLTNNIVAVATNGRDINGDLFTSITVYEFDQTFVAEIQGGEDTSGGNPGFGLLSVDKDGNIFADQTSTSINTDNNILQKYDKNLNFQQQYDMDVLHGQEDYEIVELQTDESGNVYTVGDIHDSSTSVGTRLDKFDNSLNHLTGITSVGDYPEFKRSKTYINESDLILNFKGSNKTDIRALSDLSLKQRFSTNANFMETLEGGQILFWSNYNNNDNWIVARVKDYNDGSLIEEQVFDSGPFTMEARNQEAAYRTLPRYAAFPSHFN